MLLRLQIDVAANCIALAAGTVHSTSEARYWLRIAISAYPTCIPRHVREVSVGILPYMPFGTEKLEWCALRTWR